jgi:hypothetical protein
MDWRAGGSTADGSKMDCRNKSGNDSVFEIDALRQPIPPLSFTGLSRESMLAADRISKGMCLTGLPWKQSGHDDPFEVGALRQPLSRCHLRICSKSQCAAQVKLLVGFLQ